MNNISALMNEAVALHRAGRLAEAAELYRHILKLDSRQPQAYSNLGAALRGLGNLDEAESCYRRAIAIKPDYADAHINLANLLKRSRSRDALLSFERAIALKPDAGFLYNYGLTLHEVGRPADAAAAYRRAIAIRSDFADAWSNLGVALADQNQLEDAVDAYRRAIALSSDPAQTYDNLGLALLEQGRLPDAIAAFDQSVALAPQSAEAKANRVFAELYRPGVRLADMQPLSRQQGGRAVPARAARKEGLPRIGFVSADFRQHAVGFLVIPALEGLSELGHEIVCYSNSTNRDALTERFRACAALWREVSGMSDTELEQLIRADGVDILFDLSGHSRGNRLPVFRRRPAPVQIAWVGYPATTGLSEMDYLLTDPWQTPTGSDAFYTETLLRMPHSYIAFEPPSNAPTPGTLPALTNRFVTFACFNTLKKVNAGVIEVWARILGELEDARLILKSPALDCARTRERALASFVSAGIAESRLELFGRSSSQEHVALMGRADIALDSFPYSGGMTTLESLWMGLPVITLPGETFASRHSLGYLSTVGLSELVADGADDYVDIAVKLARDIDRLAQSRDGMRERVLASPLTDKKGFAAALSDRLKAIVSGAG